MFGAMEGIQQIQFRMGGKMTGELCLFCGSEIEPCTVSKKEYFKCKNTACARYNRLAVAGLKEGFDAFWHEYPRKEGKKSCKQWWFQNRPDKKTVDRIIYTVKTYQEHVWSKTDITFTPLPYTYLFQERWENDVESLAKTIVKEEKRKTGMTVNAPSINATDHSKIPKRDVKKSKGWQDARDRINQMFKKGKA